jgi:hypothetical protein
METFRIIPILGRKTDVPANDLTMFKPVAEGVVLTHDAGGVNFDLNRKRNACTKSEGYIEWSNSATAQATKCLGLFELYDGTDRDHIYFDNGKCYVYDSALDPQVVEDGSTTTFANDNGDFYSIIKVGTYMVFADRAEHTPYKWKNGDATLSKLIASGTEYKFRYLVPFQRRVVGLYSDQTNGDIDLRWSTSWPGTAIASLNYPAANQLYIPNDDPITGGAVMGTERCYIYCEDSINQLVYYPDYETPFRLFTVSPSQGCAGHFSIINLGNRHLLFNKNYGFCQYVGGDQLEPISESIKGDVQNIDPDYYDIIYGTYVPLNRTVVWSVPANGSSTQTQLWFYNIDTGNWTIEDKTMRCVANWRMVDNYTWNDLITALGGAGAVWTDAGTNTWAFYLNTRQRLAYSNTDGKLYYQAGEDEGGNNIDGYRIEPIMDFGVPYNFKYLKELWFEITDSVNCSIDVSHRSGDTVGEVEDASWSSVGGISCNSVDRPVIHVNKNARLHQIKWGTNLKDEKFQVNNITFKYEVGSNV